MHLPILALGLTTAAALAGAQVTINEPIGTFECPPLPENGAYYSAQSLTTNIIVRCAGTIGTGGNCNDNLAGVPPIGIKTSALCYQSSIDAGDAACSYNGIVFPDNGHNFPIPVSATGSSGSSSTKSTNNSTPATGSLTTTVISNTSAAITPLTSTSTFTGYVGASTIPELAGYSGFADLGLPISVPYLIPTSTNGTGGALTGSLGSAARVKVPRKARAPSPQITGRASMLAADGNLFRAWLMVAVVATFL